MKTQETQTDWEKNYHYIEAQFNKLVRDTDKPYQFCLIDYYGNKTNYFSIDSTQMEEIGSTLKNITR